MQSSPGIKSIMTVRRRKSSHDLPGRLYSSMGIKVTEATTRNKRQRDLLVMPSEGRNHREAGPVRGRASFNMIMEPPEIKCRKQIRENCIDRNVGRHHGRQPSSFA